MRETIDIVGQLEGELAFLENGGYRSTEIWHGHLIFEESPTCAKGRFLTCQQCALLDFVPPGHRAKTSPCRYIPLTETGKSLNHLYRTATQAETDLRVRIWLKKMIRRLKEGPDEVSNPILSCRQYQGGL